MNYPCVSIEIHLYQCPSSYALILRHSRVNYEFSFKEDPYAVTFFHPTSAYQIATLVSHRSRCDTPTAWTEFQAIDVKSGIGHTESDD